MFRLFLIGAFAGFAGVSMATQDAPNMLLMSFEPPPATESLYASYAEAGFNTITLNPGAGFENAAALAADKGLSVLLSDLDAIEDQTRAWVALAESTPAAAGWLVDPLVNARDAETAARRVQDLAKECPNRLSLAFIEATGGEGPALAERLLEAGLTAFGWRAFTLGRDGSFDAPRYFGNLARAHELAREHDALWIGFVQVTETDVSRFASESDIRMQAYSQLAFGAHGLAYYRYWVPIVREAWNENPAAGMRQTMVNPHTGERHYTWEKVAEVNREVQALWPVLRTLTVDAVYFAGEVPAGMPRLPFGTHLIKSVTAPSALVSFMREPDGGAWVFVVNTVHGMQRSAKATERTLRLHLDGQIDSVTEVARTAGERRALPITRNDVYLTLPGGTGALLQLTPRSPGAPKVRE